MKEDFLHYLWMQGLCSNRLQLADGTPVEVISAGEHNRDSGPDFFNAKIKIGATVWAGNVEIHVLASDWMRHNHQNNPAFNNVILHVVAKNDAQIVRPNGEPIPVVELESPAVMYEQYLFLMQSRAWVPCELFINEVSAFEILGWKETLLVERLMEKSKIIEERFYKNNKNWEETFYQSLAANFGFKINSLPFEMLAQSIPLNSLAKHKDQLGLVEALLFGQAGLIPKNPAEVYTQQLAKDFQHLKNKFELQPMSGHLWKFSKMRPSNFPTLRIAQFAQLIHQSHALLSLIMESKSIAEVAEYFKIEGSEYWKTHYVFEKASQSKAKILGSSAFENIVMNTLAPFFAFYASVKNNAIYTEKAMDWLQQLRAEQNTITRHWEQLGLNIQNAFDTQALIQLKNQYCNHRRCLDCRIGNQVIRHRF